MTAISSYNLWRCARRSPTLFLPSTPSAWNPLTRTTLWLAVDLDDEAVPQWAHLPPLLLARRLSASVSLASSRPASTWVNSLRKAAPRCPAKNGSPCLLVRQACPAALLDCPSVAPVPLLWLDPRVKVVPAQYLWAATAHGANAARSAVNGILLRNNLRSVPTRRLRLR